MITFKQIRFKNFMSYGNKETVLNLDFKGLKLILGENKDQPMETSNGAGKTQIINAIIYALFGKGIDGALRSNEFINFANKKSMIVTLDFTDGKRNYRIIRGRKPNKLELTIDDDSQTLDSMKNTDEMIEKIIGMNFDTFMTCFFLSPHRKNYMAMPPAEQRDLFETILSLDALSERAESVKKLKKDYETDQKLLERDIDHAHQTNRMIEDELSRLESRMNRAKEEHEQTISELKAELDDLNEFDEQTLKDLIETREEGLKHKEELTKEKDEINKSHRSKFARSTELKTDIGQFQFQLDSARGDNHKHDEFDRHKKEEIDQLKKELEAHELTKEEYEELIEHISENESIRQRIKEIQSNISADESAIKRCESDKKTIEGELEQIESSTCPTCGQTHKFDEFEIESRKDAIRDMKQQIKLHKDDIKQAKQEISELTSELHDLDGIELSDIKKHLEDINRIHNRIESVESSSNPYQVVDQEHIKDLDKKIARMEKEFKKIDDDIAKDNEHLEGISTKLAEIDEILEEVESILKIADVHDLDGIERLHKKKDEFQKKIKKKFDKKPFEDEKKEIEKKFKDIKQLEQDKKDLSEKIEHAGILIKLLTDNKSFIRKNIVSRYVPFVNTKILEYSRKLGLNHHTVKIESDLSSSIEYMGESVSYFNMSAGERLRLQTSVAFAFRDLMSMMGREFNMMLVDELVDSGGDASMTELTLSFIQNMTNGLMISHKQEALEYVHHKDRILVQKINGFSRIVDG